MAGTQFRNNQVGTERQSFTADGVLANGGAWAKRRRGVHTEALTELDVSVDPGTDLIQAIAEAPYAQSVDEIFNMLSQPPFIIADAAGFPGADAQEVKTALTIAMSRAAYQEASALDDREVARRFSDARQSGEFGPLGWPLPDDYRRVALRRRAVEVFGLDVWVKRELPGALRDMREDPEYRQKVTDPNGESDMLLDRKIRERMKSLNGVEIEKVGDLVEHPVPGTDEFLLDPGASFETVGAARAYNAFPHELGFARSQMQDVHAVADAFEKALEMLGPEDAALANVELSHGLLRQHFDAADVKESGWNIGRHLSAGLKGFSADHRDGAPDARHEMLSSIAAWGTVAGLDPRQIIHQFNVARDRLG